MKFEPSMFWRRRKPTHWKVAAGIAILCTLLVFAGMQVQSWRNETERAVLLASIANLNAECERRVGAVREHYAQEAKERSGVVDQVKVLADKTLQTQQATLDLLKERMEVTNEIARGVTQLDHKATSAASEAKAAKDEARRAVRAAEVGTAASRAAAVAVRKKN